MLIDNGMPALSCLCVFCMMTGQYSAGLLTAVLLLVSMTCIAVMVYIIKRCRERNLRLDHINDRRRRKHGDKATC